MENSGSSLIDARKNAKFLFPFHGAELNQVPEKPGHRNPRKMLNLTQQLSLAEGNKI